MAPLSNTTGSADQSTSPLALSVGEYNVQNMSNWSVFIFVFAAMLSVMLVLGIVVGSGCGVIGFVIGIAADAALIVYLFRYLQQRMLVTVAPGSIRIRYLRSPFFVQASDMDLVPGDIESYKFDNFNGARFELYMKNGRKFRAAVGNIGKTRNIENMAEHIIAILTDKQYSSAVASATQPHRRKTYAEGTTGLVLAIVVIAAMIALAIGIIFFPENHKTSDTVRGIGVMFTCLAFVLHIFKIRRKALKEKEEANSSSNG